MQLNQRAARLCDAAIDDAERLKIDYATLDCGTRLIDCGVHARGGLEAGLFIARVCTAGLADVRLLPAPPEVWAGLSVMVTTDHPVAACMASQYAGWEIKGEKYFAMGSGPMRAAAAREPLFEKIGQRESPDLAVGILESGKLPPDEVCRRIAEQCGVAPAALTLLIAPTSSQAGTIQVVARSIETALHKLADLDFDLSVVEGGLGTAPLPPVAGNDLEGVGRTNDAILYGGEVTLMLRCDDAQIEEVGPRVPSSVSPDYGSPFLSIFEQYDHDFYRIDPHLFSPAEIRFVNLATGHSFRYGHKLPRVIHESFAMR